MKFHNVLFRRPLTSAYFDACLGQWFFFGAALGFLVLALVKLTTLPLTEYQLFVGLLAILACTLLMVLVGLVLPLTVRPESKNND